MALVEAVQKRAVGLTLSASPKPAAAVSTQSTFAKYQLHGAYHYTATLGTTACWRYDLRLAARSLTAVKMLDLQPGELVLDAGSGEGVAAILCCRKGARVIAVELDPEAQRLGRQIAAQEGLARPQLQFLQADLYALPLTDRSGGKVISLEVIEHMEDVAQYLSELARVLKT